MISKLIEALKGALKNLEYIKWINKHTKIDIPLLILELEATQWISVEDKMIPMLEFVLAGLFVNKRTAEGQKYRCFEYWLISIDEAGNVRNQDGDYISEWSAEGFEYWQPLPQPPEELTNETHDRTPE